jgi:hypothetical protein
LYEIQHVRFPSGGQSSTALRRAVAQTQIQLELGPRPSVCGGRGADLAPFGPAQGSSAMAANCDRFGLGRARIGHARRFNLQRFLQEKGRQV